MNSVQLVGLALTAGGLVWTVFLLGRTGPSRQQGHQPSLPTPEPKLKSGLQTRLDALVSLDALLTYCTETNNASGVAAVQQAMAAIVQVKLDE